jgi:hypothetical protein
MAGRRKPARSTIYIGEQRWKIRRARLRGKTASATIPRARSRWIPVCAAGRSWTRCSTS